MDDGASAAIVDGEQKKKKKKKHRESVEAAEDGNDLGQAVEATVTGTEGNDD